MSNPSKRKGNTPINVWVTPEEKELIKANAAKHGQSTSAFLRNVGLGFTVNTILDQQAITQLAKINGDQGRLGGLLKLWLTNDDRLSGISVQQIAKLLQLIYESQEELLEKVKTL